MLVRPEQILPSKATTQLHQSNTKRCSTFMLFFDTQLNQFNNKIQKAVRQYTDLARSLDTKEVNDCNVQ